MNGFLNDLRFGLRQLAAKPGFAAAAILTLALGIGANMAVFSVLNGYLLKPLPYPHGERLIDVSTAIPKMGFDRFAVSAANYREIKQWTTAFSGVAIYKSSAALMRVGNQTIKTNLLSSTASLFKVLGVAPLLGHGFSADSELRGREHIVLLSYGFWQRTFGGDPNIVGRNIRLAGDAYRIAGVMPKGFAFGGKQINLWTPLTLTPKMLADAQVLNDQYSMIARLRPRATLRDARNQLAAVLSRLAPVAIRYNGKPTTFGQVVEREGYRFTAHRYRDELVGHRRQMLFLLQAAVLLVLAITCVNVANLLLARILGRTHELAMRSTLGASRGTLIRQLLAEGLCLAVPGGLAGAALGWWSLHFIRQLWSGPGAGVFDIAPDWRVSLFALGVVMLVTLVISLLPIRHFSRTDLQSVLQEGGRVATGGRGTRHARSVLVIVEMAFATALLAGAGLLLRSFIQIEKVDPGFKPDGVLTASVLVPRGKNVGTASLHSFYTTLLADLRTLPGVASAGLVNAVPFSGWRVNAVFRIRDYESAVGGVQPSADQKMADGGYFATMGITILQGRAFGDQDTPSSQPVVVIDQSLAEKYFPGENAVGRELKLKYGYGNGGWYWIVGVAGNVQTDSLSTRTHHPMIYLDAVQSPFRGMDLAIKSRVPYPQLRAELKATLHRLNPAVALYNVKPMNAYLSSSLQDRQAVVVLVMAFGAIALALAIVGIYGVMSYMVSQRRIECGVRLALGALPEDLVWLVLKDGLKLLGAGLTVGLLLAVIFGYTMSAQLFGVAPFDPLTLIGTAVMLSAITLIACYFPARRAAKLDPAVAMTEQ